MEEKFGIENLKLLISIPIELGNISAAIVENPDKSWKRWLKFMDILDEAIGLLKIQWSQIKVEYDDLSDLEREQIKLHLVEKFDIANDKIEDAVERSFSILFNIEASIKDAIALFKNLK